MASKYHFILKASSYSAPGITVRRPFDIFISEDDERFPLFNNGCFIKEFAGEDTPVPAAPEAHESRERETPFSKGGQQDEGDDVDGLLPVSILLEYGIAQNVVTNLAANNYEYLKDILTDTPEDLQKIEGIGEVTAKKIFEAAKAVSKINNRS